MLSWFTKQTCLVYALLNQFTFFSSNFPVIGFLAATLVNCSLPWLYIWHNWVFQIWSNIIIQKWKNFKIWKNRLHHFFGGLKKGPVFFRNFWFQDFWKFMFSEFWGFEYSKKRLGWKIGGPNKIGPVFFFWKKLRKN